VSLKKEGKNIKNLMVQAKQEIQNEKTQETLQELINGWDDFEKHLEEKKKDKGE